MSAWLICRDVLQRRRSSTYCISLHLGRDKENKGEARAWSNKWCGTVQVSWVEMQVSRSGQEKARVFCDPRVVSWPPHMNLFLHPLQRHFVSSSAYNVLILFIFIHLEFAVFLPQPPEVGICAMRSGTNTKMLEKKQNFPSSRCEALTSSPAISTNTTIHSLAGRDG